MSECMGKRSDDVEGVLGQAAGGVVAQNHVQVLVVPKRTVRVVQPTTAILTEGGSNTYRKTHKRTHCKHTKIMLS